MILGDGGDCIFSTDCNMTGINNNVLVVGGSGSGKTMSVAEPALLEARNRSLITTVTKRRIVSKYAPLLKERGYDIWDLDFTNPQRGNIGYDPMDYIGGFEDITFLARSIVLASPRKEHSNGDPYWDEASISVLSAMIAFVMMTKKNPSFADVLSMVDHLAYEECNGQIVTCYDYDFMKLAEDNPSNFAVTNWNNFKRLPIKTAGCVFATLNTALSSVFNEQIRSTFRMKKKVNFEHLAHKKTVLFITTSPVNPSLNYFISMFYGHAFQQLFEIGERCPEGILPLPVQLIADDFATGCPVPQFEQYISIFREKGISVMLLIQSESQLHSLYGSDAATTIINNCDSYVFMGSNDLTTAQNISLRVNKPLEDILYMKLGRQILFRRGDRPKMVQRYNIQENEIYRKVTDSYQRRIQKRKRVEFQKGA